jgi:hypothetical protein
MVDGVLSSRRECAPDTDERVPILLSNVLGGRGEERKGGNTMTIPSFSAPLR